MCWSGGWSVGIGEVSHIRRCRTNETCVPFLLQISVLLYLTACEHWKWWVFLETLLPSDTWFTLLHGPLKMWIDQLTGVSNKNIAAVEPRPAKRRNNLAIEDLAFCQRIWSNRRSCSMSEDLIQRLIVAQVEGRLGRWRRRVWAGLKIDLRLWSK